MKCNDVINYIQACRQIKDNGFSYATITSDIIGDDLRPMKMVITWLDGFKQGQICEAVASKPGLWKGKQNWRWIYNLDWKNDQGLNFYNSFTGEWLLPK